jgi:uncharacterized membrane protein YhaH (DUF805 family)
MVFSFQGKIGRLPYALWVLPIFFSQHVVTLIALRRPIGAFLESPEFYIAPLHYLVNRLQPPTIVLVLALAYLIIAAWLLAALSFRRAADAGVNEWIAAAAVAPAVQIIVILYLCVAPPRRADTPEPTPVYDDQTGWHAGAQGTLAGMGLTLAAVAVGALVFGVYGYAMFLVSPFVIGAITGYLSNRAGDIGAWRTFVLVAGAAALGGIALLVVALEGLVCIILTGPLGIGIAGIGGALGRAIALSSRRSPRETLPGLAMLPLVFAIESVLGATTSFDTTETMTVDAPSPWVWQSIIHMDTIDEPPALPFRLGVAYPLRGGVEGEGIGAMRRGEFSTGTAIERVTEWQPERKLAFVVEQDVPGMRELSPYEHVHSPHVVGYFVTTTTSFELSPLADGRTQIVEHTAHELKLNPVFYWLPLARYIVHLNNTRVLTHIAHSAERAYRGSQAVFNLD